MPVHPDEGKPPIFLNDEDEVRSFLAEGNGFAL